VGSIVVNAVRWHSLAFLRHSRTDSVSLDDPFSKVIGVMCLSERQNNTTWNYYLRLELSLNRNSDFDLNERHLWCLPSNAVWQNEANAREEMPSDLA
jgi:hypothetical protein